MPSIPLDDSIRAMFDEPGPPAPLVPEAGVPDRLDDGHADNAGLLLVQVAPVTPAMTCEELLGHFAALDPSVQSLPVVQDGRPLGLVSRTELVDKFSRRYFREIYGKKPLAEVMVDGALTVDQGLSLDELGALASAQGASFLRNGFIITDQGRYVGMGTGTALLRELTERKQAHLASALERATSKLLLAQEGLLERQRMRQELALAHEIQGALLPKLAPEIAGYELRAHYLPAQELGGDYYDFIELGPHLHGFVVADVSGKGVPGSLGMTMARSTLRTQAAIHLRPDEVLRRTNAALLPDLRAGMFITLFYAVLDPANHRLACVNGGHQPALHVRGGTVTEVGGQGMALGLAPSPQYFAQQEVLALQAGDLLLLYTDGVTEAMDPQDQEYGLDRLMGSLLRHAAGPLDALLPGLLKDLAAFTGSAPQSDDITLLALRRR
jgi:serine phosphatase RsbU (regulator of sigma subunit)